MSKQKLSPEAKAAKKKRDLEAANSRYRERMRADTQKKRRNAEKKYGKAWLKGKDYDHEDGHFESVRRNRGNDGNGTKSEGSLKRNRSKRKKN